MMYTVGTISEIMLSNLFAIVSTVRITAVQISKNLKCAKQTGISNCFKNRLNMMYTVCPMSEIMI